MKKKTSKTKKNNKWVIFNVTNIVSQLLMRFHLTNMNTEHKRQNSVEKINIIFINPKGEGKGNPRTKARRTWQFDAKNKSNECFDMLLLLKLSIPNGNHRLNCTQWTNNNKTRKEKSTKTHIENGKSWNRLMVKCVSCCFVVYSLYPMASAIHDFGFCNSPMCMCNKYTAFALVDLNYSVNLHYVKHWMSN